MRKKRVIRKPKRLAGKQRKPSLAALHRMMRSPLVLRRAQYLSWHNKRLFRAWLASKQFGILPEGTPYKISNSRQILKCGGAVVDGLNKPFILVSRELNAAERREVARHELREWALGFDTTDDKKEGCKKGAHSVAMKRGNPRIVSAVISKLQKRQMVGS